MAKNSTFATRKISNGSKYALRCPRRYATVKAPGRVSRWLKLRMTRPSTSVNARSACPNRPRSVRSLALGERSPHAGQYFVATVLLHVGQIQGSLPGINASLVGGVAPGVNTKVQIRGGRLARG